MYEKKEYDQKLPALNKNWNRGTDLAVGDKEGYVALKKTLIENLLRPDILALAKEEIDYDFLVQQNMGKEVEIGVVDGGLDDMELLKKELLQLDLVTLEALSSLINEMTYVATADQEEIREYMINEDAANPNPYLSPSNQGDPEALQAIQDIQSGKTLNKKQLAS